jgi:hypothetical protein
MSLEKTAPPAEQGRGPGLGPGVGHTPVATQPAGHLIDNLHRVPDSGQKKVWFRPNP